MSKSYNRHLSKAKNHKGTYTAADIKAVRMCIHRSKVKPAWDLIAELNDGGYSITREQSEFGINWLKDACFKKDGSLRNSKLSKCFGIKERNVILNFSHFTFEGVRYSYNQYSCTYSTTPIYRTHSTNGDYFDYTMEYWGLPEVTYTSYAKFSGLKVVSNA